MINHLLHNSINKKKWDLCMESTGLLAPFGYSWYLDTVSPGWNALVLNDYEAVMPLTYRTKWGVNYLYQPIVCQQLGVLSGLNGSIYADDFIKAIPRKYKLAEINLNSSNQIQSPEGFSVLIQTNYLLNLEPSYNSIFDGYSRSHKKNVAKAIESGVEIVKNQIGFNAFYNEIMKNFEALGIKLPKHKQLAYHRIFGLLGEMGEMNIYTALRKGQNLGSACFVKYKGWATLDLYNTKQGKELAAGYLLIDAFIEENAGNRLTLDFMGSVIPGVAYRNKGFGSIEVSYPHVRLNRLPGMFRWLK